MKCYEAHPRARQMTISTLMLILLLTFGVACAFDCFAKSHHYRARGSRGLS